LAIPNTKEIALYKFYHLGDRFRDSYGSFNPDSGVGMANIRP
jgi:hypothetical protein